MPRGVEHKHGGERGALDLVELDPFQPRTAVEPAVGEALVDVGCEGGGGWARDGATEVEELLRHGVETIERAGRLCDKDHRKLPDLSAPLKKVVLVKVREDLETLRLDPLHQRGLVERVERAGEAHRVLATALDLRNHRRVANDAAAKAAPRNHGRRSRRRKGEVGLQLRRDARKGEVQRRQRRRGVAVSALNRFLAQHERDLSLPRGFDERRNLVRRRERSHGRGDHLLSERDKPGDVALARVLLRLVAVAAPQDRRVPLHLVLRRQRLVLRHVHGAEP